MNLKKLLILIIGALSFAIGFKLFMQDYEIVSGGITGLSILVAPILNIQESDFILYGNLLLLLIGYKLLGLEFLKKTIIGSLLFPIFVMVIPSYHFTDKLIFVCLFGGLFTGIGIACLYFSGGSTGGTTIVAKLIHHFTKLSFAFSMAFCDGIIVVLGFLVLGIKKGVCALVMICVATIVSQTLEKKLGNYENR